MSYHWLFPTLISIIFHIEVVNFPSKILHDIHSAQLVVIVACDDYFFKFVIEMVAVELFQPPR